MSLRLNNSEIYNVVFNGTEIDALRFNGTGYFGKRFSLTKNSSTGVSFSAIRTSSPNQQAGTGSINPGNTVYYGDEIQISISADSGYTNPKLYVDIGDGNGFVLRTSPFTFTVNADIRYYGTAVNSQVWQTVWSGAQTFTSSGSFTVPGIVLGCSVRISGEIEFLAGQYESTSGNTTSSTAKKSLNKQSIPTTVSSISSSVNLTVSNNQIVFQFVPYELEFKGYVIYESPVKITITEVEILT